LALHNSVFDILSIMNISPDLQVTAVHVLCVCCTQNVPG